MIEAELAYAFTAGMIAAVNPCGFAMLPAYLSYFLGLEGAEDGRTSSVGRALAVAGVVTAGFVTVFGVIGLLITHLGVSIFGQLPWVTMGIGAALVVLGLAMAVGGLQINLRLPKVHAGRIGADLVSMFVFGVSYAVASLSCTIGIFLPLMTRTFRSGNFASGLSVFVMYALGMGVLLAALTVTIAGARTAMVARLRAAMPVVNRVAGAVIVVAGVYLAYFGWWERGVLSDDVMNRPPDGPVAFVTSLSGSISGWVRSVGATRIGVVLGAAVLIAVIVVIGLRRPAPKEPAPTG